MTILSLLILMFTRSNQVHLSQINFLRLNYESNWAGSQNRQQTNPRTIQFNTLKTIKIHLC